jgi:hypothetical protein
MMITPADPVPPTTAAPASARGRALAMMSDASLVII